MAGHSKFKNIMHRKGAQDAKRAKIFTKLVREIITAVRVGGIDINFNSRLRLAINNAKSLNLPKDRIDNAITKGSSPSNNENYEELRYEGYMPGRVAVIIETLTDNRNRTASDIRSAFTKFGGNLGETNSVSFMFDKVGIIEYPISVATEEEIFNSAIESNANNCELIDSHYKIICDFNNFNEVREFLTLKYGEPERAELSWIAHNIVEIKDILQQEKLEKFLDLLEDNDDVQNIYTNYN